VGVPEPGVVAVTEAMRVTDCPKAGYLTDEMTLVEVLALLTIESRA
jgi:hypothetical protein